MAFAYFDRVKESSTSTGPGVFTLAGAILGFQAFSAVYANADTLHYVIFQASTGAWEVGFGTWLTGNQLQRTTVLASSNAGAAVNFAAGSKEVFVQSPASIPSLQGAHFFSVLSAAARDAIPATTLRLGSLARLLSDGSFWHWTGSAWVSFAGFAPTGSAAGQTQIYNGSTWVAGALDLADPDSHTGILGVPSGGTGLGSAGGVANRVLTTLDGIAWAAGLVSLVTMVSGLLPSSSFVDGAATSVYGRAAATVGVQASIASSADGQVLRRAAGSLGFGAVDLADIDAVTGLLPVANLVGGTAVGQVLRNNTGNVPSWGAADLADPDAVTGLLPLANIANGSALSVLGRSAATIGVMASIAGTADQVLAVNTAGTALAFGQVQTGGYATSSVTLAKLANATASSVLGRSAATGGAYADITSSADGQVLRRGAAGVVGFGAVDLADVDAVTGLLPFANLASGSATSVFARASGTAGVMASLAASADGQVLQRVAGALAFSTLGVGTIGGGSAVGQVLINTTGNVPAWGSADLADPDAVTGLLPFANIASLTGLSVFGRSASTAGVMAAITGSADQLLAVNTAGTALTFGQVQTGGYATSSITLAKLANATASSVLGRSAATGGAYADITSSADGQVLRRGAAGVISFGAVDLADPDAVTGLLPFANIASLTGLSVFGRSAATSGVMAAITGTADQVLAVNTAGTALAFGQVQTGGIATGAVTLAKLANSTASSVLGKATIGSGPYADITASATGQVLRVDNLGVIGWGSVDLADPDAVGGLLPFANIASLAGLSVFGRSVSTSGVMAAITAVTTNHVLRYDGTSVGFGTISGAVVNDGSVPVTKLANALGTSVLGRSPATGGAYADIQAGSDGQVLRRASGVLGWGAVDLADIDAITGLLPLANITPDSFAGRVLTSTGTSSAWGTTLGNAFDSFNINGTNVALSVTGGTIFQLVDVGGSTNRVVGLFKNSIGLAQMPAGTGDNVLYWGTTPTPPTSANPVGGYLLFGDVTGFYVRGPSGAVTQLGQA